MTSEMSTPSEAEFGSVSGSGLDRTYITRSGDTLEAIAGFFYGDEQHRQRLIDDNPDFASVQPGETLPAGTRLSVSEDPSRGDTVASPS